MTWLQHTTTQLSEAGVHCQFSASGHRFTGWIMPDGMGVFHQGGHTLEIQPDTIVTDHIEGLRRARQGAANRHFERWVLSCTDVGVGEWIADGDKWVKVSSAEMAGVMGCLSIHVMFKARAAELMRFYTEFQSEKHAQPHGSDSARKGAVGCTISAGEVLRTSSGRFTSPFPKIDAVTKRKTSNTLKRGEQWLMQNAIVEATARGDEFNTAQFKAALNHPQQADKDSAEQYLFGDQPAVARSPLRRLVPTKLCR